MLSSGGDGDSALGSEQQSKSNSASRPHAISRHLLAGLRGSESLALLPLTPGNAPFPVHPYNAAELSALAWRGERLETDSGDRFGSNQFSTFAEDGKLASFLGVSALEGEDNCINAVLWDLKNGQRKSGLSVAQPKNEQLAVIIHGESFALSVDARFLALRNGISREKTSADVLVVLDLQAKKEVLHEIRKYQALQAITFARDKRLLLTACANAGEVEVWDVPKGTQRKSLKAALLTDVPFLRFSPDGRLLVAATNSEYREKGDGRLVVWETASGSVRQALPCGGRITSLAFSADSQILASGGADGTILLWSMTGQAEQSNPAEKLTPEQRNELWEALADSDSGKAFPTMCRLIRQSQTALSLFREKVEPDQEQKDEPDSDPQSLETLAPSLLRQVRMVEILERIGTA